MSDPTDPRAWAERAEEDYTLAQVVWVAITVFLHFRQARTFGLSDVLSL